jgi:hypothetical protein
LGATFAPGVAGDGWLVTTVSWWNPRTAIEHARDGLVAIGLFRPSDQVVIVV